MKKLKPYITDFRKLGHPLESSTFKVLKFISGTSYIDAIYSDVPPKPEMHIFSYEQVMEMDGPFMLRFRGTSKKNVYKKVSNYIKKVNEIFS